MTLFHRGRAGAGLFPECAHFIGNRERDLHLLENGNWDATVDLSAYLPRQVHALGQVLKQRSGLYALVSSTAVYAAPQAFGFDEDSPRVALADPACEEVTDETYGGLKVLCEQAAEKTFSNLLIVRPTYVVGPFDYTGRFTYWVERIARGGEVLAPGPQEAFFQLIDVRDLTGWVTKLLEQHVEGTFHVANPFPPVTFAQLLEDIARAVAPAGTRFTWVDRSFLTSRQASSPFPQAERTICHLQRFVRPGRGGRVITRRCRLRGGNGPARCPLPARVSLT